MPINVWQYPIYCLCPIAQKTPPKKNHTTTKTPQKIKRVICVNIPEKMNDQTIGMILLEM
jgi:hypothetical protein